MSLPYIAVRSSEGVEVIKPIADEATPDSSVKPDKSRSCKVMAYSPSGRLLAWCNGQAIIVVDIDSGAVVQEISRARTVELSFSPLDTYLTTWENYAVRDGVGQDNLCIWKVEDGSLAFSCVAKRHEIWCPEWSDDESIMCRNVTNNVHVFDGSDLTKGVQQSIKIPNVSKFSLSPGPAPHKIAAFIPSEKSAPAAVRVYQGPGFLSPINNKSFYKADKVSMLWNSTGTALLVSTQTEVDQTGKSYYGETNLYYLDCRGSGESMRVHLDKEGPISDVSWNPKGNSFAVVYGFMPAKTCMFDVKCNKVKDFGTGPRSMVKFSPAGNILAIAGFGNLRGEVEFWSMHDFKLLNRVLAADSTIFEWCPDSRHILTATCSPRLKVDNGYKIWHYTRGELFKKPFKELYHCAWRPVPADTYPERPISPIPETARKAATEGVKKQAYRPPGARGRPVVKKPDPTQETKPLSKNALKNKKKREKKQASSDEQPPPSTSSSSAPSSKPPSSSSSSANPDVEKKIRNLTKKLRQIESLKEKQEAGEELQLNQLDKLKTETSVRGELEKLQAQLSS